MNTLRRKKHFEVVAGYEVACSARGTLFVFTNGTTISVLPQGTHAALDALSPQAKKEIVAWWKKVR